MQEGAVGATKELQACSNRWGMNVPELLKHTNSPSVSGPGVMAVVNTTSCRSPQGAPVSPDLLVEVTSSGLGLPPDFCLSLRFLHSAGLPVENLSVGRTV